MKEHIKIITHASGVLSNITHDKDTISRSTAKLIQDIIDEIQEAIDAIENEWRKVD